MKPMVWLSGMMARCRSWWRGVTRGNDLDSEMEAELQDHLAHLTDDLMHGGLSRDEAARQARVALGSLLAHKEDMRASYGLRWWDEIGCDVRYGVRMLLEEPGLHRHRRDLAGLGHRSQHRDLLRHQAAAV